MGYITHRWLLLLLLTFYILELYDIILNFEPFYGIVVREGMLSVGCEWRFCKNRGFPNSSLHIVSVKYVSGRNWERNGTETVTNKTITTAIMSKVLCLATCLFFSDKEEVVLLYREIILNSCN